MCKPWQSQPLKHRLKTCSGLRTDFQDICQFRPKEDLPFSEPLIAVGFLCVHFTPGSAVQGFFDL